MDYKRVENFAKENELTIASCYEKQYLDEEITVIILANTSKRKLDIQYKNGIDYETFKGIPETLIEKIREASIKASSVNNLRKNKTIELLKACFVKAGLVSIFVEETPNEYCSDSCCYHLPWLIITSGLGRIKIGWRKRVINIDFSDSILKDIDIRDLYKDENTTVGKDYIHAWGYKKATEYLKKMRDYYKNNY